MTSKEKCQRCGIARNILFESTRNGKRVKHCEYCFICERCDTVFTRYSTPGKILCNECKSSDKQKKLEEYEILVPNIISHFENYTKTKAPSYLRNRQILSDDEFEKVIVYLQDKEPAIWADTMIGSNSDSPIKSGIMMTSEQATKLLTEKFAQPHPDHDHRCSKYIWAISYSILLLKEMSNIHHTFNHYYREIYTLSEIEDNWKPSYMFHQNQTAGNIGPCPICMEDVYLAKENYMTCTKCYHTSHTKCKLNHFFTQNKPSCEICNTIYESPNDIEWTCKTFILHNDKSGRILTWLDYYNARKLP
jgi:hypothetical protein